MLETQIASNNKRVNHLVDITSLHKQHFKAIDQKLDDISDKLSLMLCVGPFHQNDRLHGAKIWHSCHHLLEALHTAYNNRLSTGALHHEVLLEIVK